MRTTCLIETYDLDGTRHQTEIEADEQGLSELLESFREAWSATLRFEGNHQQLVVSFSSGHAAVMIDAGPDEFYDLLGNRSSIGWMKFVHGGQMAEHPIRHIVTFAAALAMTVEFVRQRKLPIDTTRWERQGEFQADGYS